MLPPLHDSLSRIWNLERARAQLYRERYQALLLEYDSASTGTPLASVANSNGNNS
jgi:hypothetical protein